MSGAVRVDQPGRRDTDKIVYSSSLNEVSTARTTIERTFEPEAVRQLKETSGSDLSIGGAGIAAEAFRLGLVDECVLLLCPVLVGGGKPVLGVAGFPARSGVARAVGGCQAAARERA